MIRLLFLVFTVIFTSSTANAASSEWLKGLRWTETLNLQTCISGQCSTGDTSTTYRVMGSSIYALAYRSTGTMFPINGETDYIAQPESLGKFKYTNSYYKRRIGGTHVGDRTITFYLDSIILISGRQEPSQYSETITFSQDLKTCEVTAYSSTGQKLHRSSCKVLK